MVVILLNYILFSERLRLRFLVTPTLCSNSGQVTNFGHLYLEVRSRHKLTPRTSARPRGEYPQRVLWVPAVGFGCTHNGF